MKILAVDDDALALDLLQVALSDFGYTDLTAANSAREAIEIIHGSSEQFQCILLDIRMPGMDGVELLGLIRTMAGYKDTPILMLTSMTDMTYVEAAFARGATDYITKPFERLELQVRLSIAKRIVDEQNRSFSSNMAEAALRSEVETILSFEFGDAIVLSDVDAVIGPMAMENYLLKWSRTKAVSSSAVGIHVRGIERMFKKCSPTNTYFNIVDIAEALTLELKSTDFLMTYLGRGDFFAVFRKDTLPDDDELAALLQSQVDALGVCYDDGTECPLEVHVSEEVTLGLWSASNAIALRDLAMDSLYSNLQLERFGATGS